MSSQTRFGNAAGKRKAVSRAAGIAAFAVIFCIAGCVDKSTGVDDDKDVAIHITFDANGGTVKPDSDTAGADGTLASLPAPIRTGYTFKGWFTAEADGEAVTDSTVFKTDTTIYAQWTHRITFDANGGTVTPESGTTGADGTLDSLPEPARTGYTFKGWYSAAKGGHTITEIKVFDEDTAIYARWEIVTYKVTFDANGGSVTPASGTTGEGWTLSSLPVPEMDGHAFEDWFTTAKIGGERVTASRVFSADAVIFARWTPAYTVKFDPDGGKVSVASGTTGAGGKLTSLPAPTRNGYAFDGWFTKGGAEVTTETVFSANTAIYAQWTLAAGVTTFVDSRDNRTYNKVTIGTQVWMAENLNYAGEESNETGACYDDDPANCAKYGRLYDWNTAMEACPAGWHLPSDAEWTILTDYVGYPEGKKLKSSDYWEYCDDAAAGTDDVGFSALPGGYGYAYLGTFSGAGYYGYWWTASNYGMYMICSEEAIKKNTSSWALQFSVRCVMD